MGVSPVAFVGALRDASGHADEARAFLDALERAGHEPGAFELHWSDRLAGLTPEEDARLRRQLRRGVTGPGVAIHHYLPSPAQLTLDGRANVARAMFETDELPQSWLGPLLDRDEIWVPSAWNVETFARGGLPESRMRVVGETIDFDRFSPGVDPYPLGVEEGRMVFLSNFDFSERKGWRQLLEAWARAFTDDDPVCLVLKTGSFYRDDAHVVERIESVLREASAGRDTAPVQLLCEMLPTKDLPRLYAAADAYVLPSRGEGWGRPYQEAIAMGLPTIASNWGGNTAFMDESYSWLVEGRIVPVAEDAELFNDLYRGHHWFEADVEHLVQVLREVAGDPDAARAKAAGGRAAVLATFGPEPIAELIATAADEVWERFGPQKGRSATLVVRGAFGGADSLRVVNDGLADALEAEGGLVRRCTPGSLDPLERAPSISHGWPPQLGPASAGPAMAILPWEHGDPPQDWVVAARTTLDRVIVPSRYVRDGFVAAGMPAGVVEVVPNGVDLERFCPDGPARELPGAATTFLFVGGTIARKGIDLLVDAWHRAFAVDDDVQLVVKDFGAGTHYAGAADQLRELAASGTVAPIVVLDDHLRPDELPALYRAADVLVAPYRGEGFCLPALEALACGVPVIHNACGPTREFVPDAAGWAVPSERTELAGSVDDGRIVLAGPGFHHAVDVDALASALRAAADPALRAPRAAAARPAAEGWSWQAAGRRLQDLLDTLAGERLALARDVVPATVPDARGTLVLHVPDPGAPDERWADIVGTWARDVPPDADASLVLPVPAATAEELGARIMQRIVADGLDPQTLPDIVLVRLDGDSPAALVAAADAVLLDDAQAAARPAALVRRAARTLVRSEVAAFAADLRQLAPAGA